MSAITNKTKGLIVIKDKLYKLSSKDFKLFSDIIDGDGGYYYQGNKMVRPYNDIHEFLQVLEEKYQPIATIFGVY